ncbi:amidase [Paucibacter sp. R3-3]|uniref:Amidase n=1 Tax=Roseateles agri TaxID=3098619 RepID=A0ABU5DMZ0_9BURK|nr:amidase [Paucibacter sp. R3-3]MDY0747093.1 amidase [Paucibacter sp. R3-3]
MSDDLLGALSRLQDDRLSARDALAHNLEALRGEACRHAFVREFADSAQAVANAADAIAAAGAPRAPLGGLTISIKDLFDVAEQPTTAGSRALADAAPAAADCPAVARLRRAGAALIGHTNMTEFAFSGLGLNPHHGTPLNPVTRAIDGLARIPGGSSSGAAVSVAAGAAWAALGSDTGGSIRIPAALQGLVGFKNTTRLTPTEGTIPLSPALDTACAITRSVRDAVLLHEILAERRVRLTARPLRARRLAVVQPVFQDGMDATVASAFERSLAALRQAGAQIEEIPLAALATLQPYRVSSVAAEAWAWHRKLLAERGDAYDPRVARRIREGEAISGADLLDRIAARRAWIAAMESALQGFDAVLSPTVPVVAPLLQPLLDSDAAYYAANGLLLRNTSIVNALDGCAISLPCHAPGELPVGLMLWSTGGQDDTILDIALQVEAEVQKKAVH